jgi:hypothetical protein
VLVINWLNANPGIAAAGSSGEGEAPAAAVPEASAEKGGALHQAGGHDGILALLAMDLAQQSAKRRRLR